MAGIDDANYRSQMLKEEKDGMQAARRAMKKETDAQKAQINEAFEKMKARGKMDLRTLEKMGFKIPDKKEEEQTIEDYGSGSMLQTSKSGVNS